MGFLFTQSTQGTWTAHRGTVISTETAGHSMEPDHLKYYGGNLIAESVAVQGDAQWTALVHNEFPRIVAALRTKLVLG